jgi:SNF2 family DNA or RNA helicase
VDTDIDAALNPNYARAQAAARIKVAARVALPHLKYWNYGPCSKHSEPQPDCEYRKCGGDFFDHQSTTIAWAYAVRKGMIASVTGSGKSNMAYGLLALLKERGELTERCVVICQTPAVLQWLEEARRWIPKMSVEAAYSGLTKPQRVQRYMTNWDVLIIGYHAFLKDIKIFENLSPGMLVIDDVDALLNHQNATHKAIMRLARKASRVLVMNATNLQTHLQQLHAATMPLDGFEVWGSLPSFERRYVRAEPVTFYNSRSGRRMVKMKTIGYKNMDEFKAKLQPLVIRHTYEDLTDVRMPEIMPPEHVWLELHPRQREKYKELQEGVLKLLTEQGTKVKHTTALTNIGYGQQICAGLPALHEADGPGASVKLDWLMAKLDSDWTDNKIVVFMKNLGLVEAFATRLDAAGIEHAKIWGNDRDAQSRKAEQDRFWNDPQCRVFIGTTAIERSLNLHAANIIVNVDTHLNPARMTQILGRIRRAGSKHTRVFVFNLFCRDTQEEKYLAVLEARQAVINAVWEEESELYEALSPLQLLQLIRP